jgi:hypothetical protein
MRTACRSGFGRDFQGARTWHSRALRPRPATLRAMEAQPRRLGGLLFLLLVALAAWALWSGALRVPERWNPWAPLRIDEAPNLLTRFKLDRTAGDRDACRAALARPRSTRRRWRTGSPATAAASTTPSASRAPAWRWANPSP